MLVELRRFMRSLVVKDLPSLGLNSLLFIIRQRQPDNSIIMILITVDLYNSKTPACSLLSSAQLSCKPTRTLTVYSRIILLTLMCFLLVYLTKSITKIFDVLGWWSFKRFWPHETDIILQKCLPYLACRLKRL